MTISISWNNPNTAFDEVQIFKSDVKPAIGEIPTNKILTITDPTITTFRDPAASINVPHWYWVAVKRRQEITYGYPIYACNMPYTGPGPQELIRGDWQRGYFGLVTTDDMPIHADMFALIKEGAGIVRSNTPVYAKFILDGKVLFCALKPVVNSVSWRNLYNSGLVYGKAGPGDASGIITGLDPVDQYVTITKNDHQFIVRLPSAMPVGGWGVGSGRNTNYNNEWNRTVGSLFNMNDSYAANIAGDMDELVRTDYFDSGGIVMMKEINAEKMSYQYSNDPNVVYPPENGIGNDYTNNTRWNPVLELIF